MLKLVAIMEVAMKVLGLGVLTLLLACGEEEKTEDFSQYCVASLTQTISWLMMPIVMAF